jgi:hypothetical protein
MKVVFCAFAVLFTSVPLFAQQSIAPSVNNLVGIDVRLTDAFVSTSIGEPAITTLGAKEGYITQGFLQPELLPCVNLEFKYYPNPAKDIITIEAYGCEVGIMSMEILDLWGRLLTKVVPTKNNEVNLGDLAQGVYLVRVTLTNDDVHTISVVKTSN